MTPPVFPPFVGRSADRDRLAAVLARLRAGLSAALVVSGDAGIGKTQLLAQVVRDAGGLQTVTMSGYESEARLGFAALHQLVSPFLGVVRELPEPQRDALSTALGLAPGPPPNRFLVGLATMALLERTARPRLLLCVIDDVQWVDQETLDTLAFTARRLDAEGVGLVFGLRSSARTLPGFSGIAEHRLRPMPDDDMRSLLSQAAPSPLVPHVATRLIAESAHAATGSDESAAAQLELTAARARERGGYAAEANFLTLSAQRSRTGTGDHSRRLLAAARAHIIAGHGARAERLLDGWNPGGTLGARIAAERVMASQMANDFRTGLEASTLMKAAAGLPSEELDLAWDLRCEALGAALETREYTRGTTPRELAQALLSQPWPPGREPVPLDLINRGLATRCASGYQAAAPLLQQALRRMRDPQAATAQHHALLTWMAMEDLWDDEFESTTWTQLTRLNQAHGAWSAAWVGWGSSAMTEARHGNFGTAQELFDLAASVGDCPRS